MTHFQPQHDASDEQPEQFLVKAKIRACTGCGRNFVVVRQWQKQCSPRCRQRAYVQRGGKLADRLFTEPDQEGYAPLRISGGCGSIRSVLMVASEGDRCSPDCNVLLLHLAWSLPVWYSG